jgi:hypothetical protein
MILAEMNVVDLEDPLAEAKKDKEEDEVEDVDIENIDVTDNEMMVNDNPEENLLDLLQKAQKDAKAKALKAEQAANEKRINAAAEALKAAEAPEVVEEEVVEEEEEEEEEVLELSEFEWKGVSYYRDKENLVYQKDGDDLEDTPIGVWSEEKQKLLRYKV